MRRCRAKAGENSLGSQMLPSSHEPPGSSAGVSPALPNLRARRPRHYSAAQVHGPNACEKAKGASHECPLPFGLPLRMKKYSARRCGLGARNLFRCGGGRTEVRAPVGLRRCRSEATVPHRRMGVSKSTVDSHVRGTRRFVLFLDSVDWIRAGGRRRARGPSGS